MRTRFGTYARTISYGFTLSIIFIVGIIPASLVAMLPERWRFRVRPLYWLEHAAFWLMIKSWWVPVVYEGLENIYRDRPVIFAANHQSALDIPLFGLVAGGRPHAWFFIRWLTKYPIFGWVIRRLEIVVDQGSVRRSVEAIDRAVSRLKKTEQNLMIFPEGGRYTDGVVRYFFPGFAIIAKKTGYPVVPVFIKNSHKLCPPRTVLIHYARIHVKVGKPFVYQPGEDKHAFCKRVRDWFVACQET